MSVLRAASDGESDALFAKDSGSRGGEDWLRWRGRMSERADQAVALEAFEPDRQDLADDLAGGHDMGRLQIAGAADDLAGIACRALEQHIDGPAEGSLVEGRLLAVDQGLKPRQSLVHVGL